MDSESWRWIWLAVAAVFAVGELSAPGTFFLLPFAIGAAVAAVLAFAGASLVVELVAFIGVSLVALAAFRNLAHRLDQEEPTDGIGSKRLIGRPAKVIEAIEGTHDLGTVRIDREEWRAESGNGEPIPVGSPVKVVEVRGTRVVVFAAEPLEAAGEAHPGGAAGPDPENAPDHAAEPDPEPPSTTD